MTKEEIERGFTQVMDQMLKAGWLESHTLTEGKGHHLVWTPLGADRAIHLREIVDAFRLCDTDKAAMAFHELSQGPGFPGLPTSLEIPDEVLKFWSDSVNAVADGVVTADWIMFFAHVIRGWAPDGNTPATVVWG